MARIPTALRLDPEIKAAAHRRATEERRTLTGYIEWLIARDVASHPREPAGRKKTGDTKPAAR